MGFELWIALRYLRVRGRELFISLLTWISVGGVALGVLTLVVVLSVMKGFEGDLREKILGMNAHVKVGGEDGLLDYDAVARKAAALPGVTMAAPFVEGQVMLVGKGYAQGGLLRGMSPEALRQASRRPAFLVQGKVSDVAGDMPGILVGKEMAVNLGLFVGDKVRVVSPASATTPAGLIPRFRVYRVAAIFFTGMYEYDTSNLIVGFDEAKDFLRLGDKASGVELRLDDADRAAEVASQLRATLGEGVVVRDWMEMNHSLFGALKLERLAMFLILGLMVVVATFNIASTLTMTVMEKSREIGILKSMGASRSAVRRVFVYEGALIGLLGTSLGVAGGLAVGFVLQKYRFIELPTDVYYIDTLPVVMEPWVFLGVAAAAMALCLVATLYPSWQAARLDPLETIRYE